MTTLWGNAAKREIGEIAQRHGFGPEAGASMASALAAGGGGMAQFGHPDLGGMGQWSQGGMLMIGDMFNHGLKGRVAGLAEDLAAAIRNGAITPERPAGGGRMGFGGAWWPDELGSPSSSGAQNDRRYAVFPDTRRLAVERDGRVTVYDTGDHRIGGAAQQQGGTSNLSFSSDRGTVTLDDLQKVGKARAEPEPQAPEQQQQQPQRESGQEAAAFLAPKPTTPAKPDAAPRTGQDPLDLIRRLAELRDAGVLTDEEFSAKKTELLSRL